MMRTLIFVTLLLIIAFPILGQDETDPDSASPVINSVNITQLQSVMTINFANYADVIGEFDTGWFVINDDASRIATVNNDDSVVIWDSAGQVEQFYASELESDIVDLDFSPMSDMFFSLHNLADGVQVIQYDVTDESIDERIVSLAGLPVELWVDNDDVAWTEVIDDESVVARLDDETMIIVDAPENDPNAFVRIGRIQPPFAITSTFEGMVSLWSMETSELIAQAQVENGPAVFGQINASGSHLAWRDPYSEGLYLLDFETGENVVVTELGNVYVQFYFLTNDADVVIGVNLDDAPNVVAWNVANGERYELGEYQVCSRVPDMVRMSRDGTAIVIGCDTGLDIWRIVD